MKGVASALLMATLVTGVTGPAWPVAGPGAGPASAQAQAQASAGVSGWVPAPPWSPAEAREAADSVLARPEYRPPRRTLVQRVWGWAAAGIGRVLDALSGGGAAGVIGWTILFGFAAAVAFLGARFARGVTADAARRAGPVAGSRLPASVWQQQAAADEAAGRWREAVRSHWRALVAELGERGLLEEVPGRTTGEYRAAVSASVPPAAGPFSAATTVFERAWYGHFPVGPGDASSVRELAQSALSSLSDLSSLPALPDPSSGPSLPPPLVTAGER